MRINTVSGPIDPDDLGKTLMHEHLAVGFPGWESDTAHAAPTIREMAAICIDKIAELKSAGFSTLLDPCPNDLGRDVALMAEVASRTGFNIICATGLYHHRYGGEPYWGRKFELNPDAEARLADLFIKELTQGVQDTGIRAGVIKISTAGPPFTDYEKTIFRAAAKASLATDAPITTHTDAVLGDEQLEFLTSLGVPPHKVIIGHSCGSPDHAYHMSIVERGGYLGFDRFGLEDIQKDAVRIDSLLKLLRKGAGQQVIVSHDCVWCWKGQMEPTSMLLEQERNFSSMRFTRVITPLLKAAGVTDAQIDELLVENPRRYFAGERFPRPMR